MQGWLKPLGMGLPGKREWFEETERVWLTWNVKILGFDSATGLPHLIRSECEAGTPESWDGGMN